MIGSRRQRRVAAAFGILALAASVALWVVTVRALRPLPQQLTPTVAERAALTDRQGRTISVSYGNRWNVADRVELHEIPEFLREAFIEAEDRRFFRHHGVDWRARLSAAVGNVRSGRAVRGASTISEQVVRMLHPRPRTLWSRWLEGFEAARLEHRFSKGEILEFYLNQVPYARQRRGVVQAARDLFNRDLDTMTIRETLTLAVLVRRPSGLDPRRDDPAARERLDGGVSRLAARLIEQGRLDSAARRRVHESPLQLEGASVAVEAPHFALHVREQLARLGSNRGRVRTTLDGALQQRLQAVLDRRVSSLSERGVRDGAVLVVDHETDAILAWVNAGGHDLSVAGSHIDAVVTPRQPGSTLKPFVYAQAMERGWTAATLVDDTPISGTVGAGIHRYRNYSREFHGPLRLREALGNSLNTPAVRAIQYVTPAAFHETLTQLGVSSLGRHPDEYGDGLALGNGEISLLELVGSYATLARGGVQRPLRVLFAEPPAATPKRVFTPQVSSIVADILSDPQARMREFGSGGPLELPYQTAVKSGTSNDYRDAWAVGFSDRHTVGIWFGDLGRESMDGITGSSGPALVLREAFAELRKQYPPRPLRLVRDLQQRRICRDTGALSGAECPTTQEWFREERVPPSICSLHALDSAPTGDRRREADVMARLLRPTPGLHMATDPRIPDELETFEFQLEATRQPLRVEWFVDDVSQGETIEPRFGWPLEVGAHVARARVWTSESAPPLETESVAFVVK